MPQWSQEVKKSLEGPLEVPEVGDMIHSTPTNEDPYQGEIVKVRNPSIPQDMAVLVSLHMQIETLMLIMML